MFKIFAATGADAGGGSVGRALTLLVMVAVLPLLLFGGGVAWMLVEQKKTAVADELAGIARALSVAVDHELRSQMSTLAILATDDSLMADDLAGFEKHARRFVSVHDDWLNVGLIAPHSHQILAGSPTVPYPPQTSLSPSHVDEVVRSRRPVIVGAFTSSKITPRPIILLMIPVMRNNEVRYVLGVAVNPKALSDVFNGQRLSTSWTGAIVDTNMRLAGRSRDAERFVGRRATATLTERIATSASGMFTAFNQEGASAYTVFSRSPLTGWSVVIGIPAAEVEGPIRRVLLQLAAAGGTLMSFALILTGMAGRSIVRRRNKYEQSLQEGKAQLAEKMREFKTILDNSSVGITLVRDRRQIWSNQRMSDILGYSAQEMDCQSTRMFYRSQASYEELGRKGYTSLIHGERFTTEQEMRCKDGTPIWMRISGKFIEDKNPASGSIWVFEDITERKRVEEENEEARSRLQKIASRLPGMVLQFRLRADGSACVPYASHAVRELCRVTEDQIRDDAAPMFAVVHPDDLAPLQASIDASAKSLTPWVHEFRFKFAGEHDIWVLGNTIPQREADGSVLWHGFITNITERKQVEAALRESEALFRSIFDSNLDAALLTTPDGAILAANPEAQRMFGRSEDELRTLGRQPLVDVTDPRLTAALTQREKIGWFRGELTLIGKDGKKFLAELSSSLFNGKDGCRMTSMLIRDITERKHAEQQLRIAAAVFDAQEGMVVTDADNMILRVNRAFTEITGYTAEEVVGRNMALFKSGRHDATFYAQMWQSLREQDTWQGEIWNCRKNGEVYPEWLTITAVKDADDVVAQYVATLTDITLRKAAEDEVKQLAFYDPLTQLPNRRLLSNRLQQALAASARSNRLGALLFIDLDNFKTLNDTLGHDVGDRLLQQVARRLAACVREGDTVARLGGDEFVIMLVDMSEARPEALTQTEIVGHKILAALNEPFALAARPYHCTASIGATLFRGQRHGVDDLMKRADLAMYDSKAAGRNTLRFFAPRMQTAITARAALETDLHRALRDREFRLYYQCQVDQAGSVTGAEALVRWQHPVRGLISPADFIPLAEEIGLILPLGHWVLETACQQLLAWAGQADTAHLRIAVNVSAVQFRQIDFVEQVLAVIERSGANPHQLKLELTESLLLDDVEDIIVKMTALKSRGIGFALDDFGTGYSSLSYLKRLPLDQLKIDQSFVRDLLTDPNDAAIARTIVALARSMGLSVIAEGVETQAQRDCLASEGCHAYQGYLFSRPLPLEQFESLLKRGVT